MDCSEKTMKLHLVQCVMDWLQHPLQVTVFVMFFFALLLQKKVTRQKTLLLDQLLMGCCSQVAASVDDVPNASIGCFLFFVVFRLEGKNS